MSLMISVLGMNVIVNVLNYQGSMEKGKAFGKMLNVEEGLITNEDVYMSLVLVTELNSSIGSFHGSLSATAAAAKDDTVKWYLDTNVEIAVGVLMPPPLSTDGSFVICLLLIFVYFTVIFTHRLPLNGIILGRSSNDTQRSVT
nr:hypothetical protein [Tanacetum cinerariifolium]